MGTHNQQNKTMSKKQTHNLKTYPQWQNTINKTKLSATKPKHWSKTKRDRTVTGGHEAWPEPSVDLCYKAQCVSSIVQTKRDRSQNEAWPNRDRTVTGKHPAGITKSSNQTKTNNKNKINKNLQTGGLRSRFGHGSVTVRSCSGHASFVCFDEDAWFYNINQRCGPVTLRCLRSRFGHASFWLSCLVLLLIVLFCWLCFSNVDMSSNYVLCVADSFVLLIVCSYCCLFHVGVCFMLYCVFDKRTKLIS